MTTLLVLLPDPNRAPVPDDATPLDHLLVQGDTVLASGCSAAGRLPQAAECVLLLPDSAVAWHRLTLPKAPRAKLRAVLGNALEDQVLDDTPDLHLALPQGAAPGSETWVAVMARQRLAALLRVLEAAGHRAERAHPLSWPGQSGPGPEDDSRPSSGYGHFSEGPALEGEDGGQIVWTDADGVAVWPLAGGHARQALAGALAGDGPSATWTATWTAAPAAASVAERWLRQPVPVLSDSQRWLQASRSPWQLLQFDLQPARKGWQHLQRLGRELGQPTWRPARWGLAALVLLAVVGLNLRWWQLSHEAQRLGQHIQASVKTAFPEIPVLLDAPLQVRQALQGLRQRTGASDPADFAVLMGAAASAWPAGAAPASRLNYDGASLSLQRGTWSGEQQQTFAASLREQGLQVLDEGAAVRLRPLPVGGTP
ncbi:type II secretion system protein GspL [Amphibiibacter pelophylacis]|uniref:Type II secretion system protein GspL n=1 Tax=Amphibiibacter pelophylacis TaxID=1799477 RepID=A0ACC6P3W7_9BURK